MFRFSLLALCYISLACSSPAINRMFKLHNNKSENRIINGEEAQNTPWVARIITSYDETDDGVTISSNCGGSLIRANWVLTARHCIFNESNQQVSMLFRVSLGKVNFFDGDIVPVREIHDLSPDDDVALLKLEHEVDIDTIAVQLENNIDYADRRARTWGWGETETGEGSDVLRTTELVLWGRNNCNSNMVCANPEITNTNVCGGDSGGPLVLDIEDEPRLIGVTHAVLNTDTESCIGDKSFFMSTSYYSSWIQNTIG